MVNDDTLPANDDAPAQPRSARVEYKAKLERARTMIATLTQLLDDHALEFVRKPDRWNMVADLNALNEMLGRAAAAIEKDRT